MPETKQPLVAVIMGSKSDWETMRNAADILKDFDVPHECRVMSAHRTPQLTAEYAASAEERGLKVIIAGAGGAAHLAGVIAAYTVVPVLGVPELDGLPLAGASGLPSADAVARLLADDADPGVTAEGAAVGGNDSLWRSTTVSAGPLAAFGLASAGGADGLLASESVGLASARSSALPR